MISNVRRQLAVDFAGRSVSTSAARAPVCSRRRGRHRDVHDGGVLRAGATNPAPSCSRPSTSCDRCSTRDRQRRFRILTRLSTGTPSAREPPSLIDFVPGNEASRRGDDPPPRVPIAAASEEGADGTSPAGIARFGGDLAVRHDVTGPRPLNTFVHGLLERGEVVLRAVGRHRRTVPLGRRRRAVGTEHACVAADDARGRQVRAERPSVPGRGEAHGRRRRYPAGGTSVNGQTVAHPPRSTACVDLSLSAPRWGWRLWPAAPCSPAIPVRSM